MRLRMALAGIIIFVALEGIGLWYFERAEPAKPVSYTGVKTDSTRMVTVIVENPDTAHTAITQNADTTSKNPVELSTRNPLVITVKNLSSEDAPVIIGVFGISNKFPDPNDQLKQYKFIPHGKELIAQVKDLQFGVYALAIYQDVNNNGKIDKNLIGIPSEPYAFSNNYKPTIRAPSFSDCKFDYDSVQNTVSLTMIRGLARP